MKTKTVELSEAQNQLVALVALAAAGMEIVLVEGTTPRARLVAPAPPVARRVPGLHPGGMEAAADFDAPLPDDYWLGTA
jgi:antitoxin (DNA-binding transcriptional repressor) of toxin-antitoxin stability system